MHAYLYTNVYMHNMHTYIHTCIHTQPFVLRLVVSSWFLGPALRLSSVELSLLLAPPLGMNSLLHSACYLRTTCLFSASFLRHFSLTRDVNTGFFGKPVFSYLKPVLNRISVLLTFIKIYYYTKKITVCITCCNVNTLKAVSTPICSRFSLKPK